jgi:hypothetical protein
MRCAGQLRLAPGGGAVLGLDLTAALSFGTALAYDAQALAELLPAGEAGLVAALNQRLQRTQD